MPAEGGGNTRAKQLKKRPAPRRAVSAPAGDTKGDLKKGASFQRSRTYYKAYEEAQRKNPVVKKAIKDVDREFTAKRYTSKKVKRAQANIEDVRRHGSDRVSEAAYRHYTAKLWDKAKDEYPKGKRPGFTVSEMPREALAYVKSNHSKVHYSPKLTRYYMDDRGSPRRRDSYTVPLHEWVHTRQKHDLPKYVAEGGAEVTRRDIAKKLKIPIAKQPSSREYAAYERYIRKVRRKRGRRSLAKAQYR